MFETVKEVYKETVTKENNIFFTRYPTASILLGNFGYFDEIYTLLMIEEDVTKKPKTIGKLKNGSMFLLNDEKNILYDKLIEKDTEKRKY